MTTTPPAGVSLEALLAAKERRAQRQSDWLTQFSQPLISLTLVTPGPIKDSPRYRQVMHEALRSADAMLRRHDWPLLRQQTLWLPTGAEALWCVRHSAQEIKAATIELEHAHPLGRLWDFDVICPQAGVIGRRALNHDGRRCLICDGPAHACARARRHPLPAVIANVEALIDGWTGTH